MILLWVVAAAALVVAALALARARQAAHRAEELLQMYWELKYQHGELRRELQQRTGDVPPTPAEPRRPSDAFVPLASLKR